MRTILINYDVNGKNVITWPYNDIAQYIKSCWESIKPLKSLRILKTDVQLEVLRSNLGQIIANQWSLLLIDITGCPFVEYWCDKNDISWLSQKI